MELLSCMGTENDSTGELAAEESIGDLQFVVMIGQIALAAFAIALGVFWMATVFTIVVEAARGGPALLDALIPTLPILAGAVALGLAVYLMTWLYE